MCLTLVDYSICSQNNACVLGGEKLYDRLIRKGFITLTMKEDIHMRSEIMRKMVKASIWIY